MTQKLKLPGLILAWVASLLLLFYLMRGCTPDCGNLPIEIESIRYETAFIERPKIVENRKPTPIAIRPSSPSPLLLNPVYVADVNPCPNDTAYYADSIKKENFLAVIIDTVYGNRITGRRFEFSSKESISTKTVTEKVKVPFRPKFQLYLGAQAMASSSSWGLGPSAFMVLPKGIGLQYTYDVKGKQHAAGAYYLISFRKQ